MSLLNFNTNPDDRQLRQFGVVCVFALPLVAWLWTRNTEWAMYAGAVGLILAGTGLFAPRLLKPVFVGLTIITLPIGMIVGEVAMLLIYLGLFLPMAILFRIIGRDSLDRRRSENPKTFWKPRQQPSSVRKYYQQS